MKTGAGGGGVPEKIEEKACWAVSDFLSDTDNPIFQNPFTRFTGLFFQNILVSGLFKKGKIYTKGLIKVDYWPTRLNPPISSR